MEKSASRHCNPLSQVGAMIGRREARSDGSFRTAATIWQRYVGQLRHNPCLQESRQAGSGYGELSLSAERALSQADYHHFAGKSSTVKLAIDRPAPQFFPISYMRAPEQPCGLHV
jgi:hypothetical protein